jgi:hypothetical protein
MSITIVRQHNGSLLVSAVHNNRLIKQVYYGFTMAQARREFINHINDANYILSAARTN